MASGQCAILWKPLCVASSFRLNMKTLWKSGGITMHSAEFHIDTGSGDAPLAQRPAGARHSRHPARRCVPLGKIEKIHSRGRAGAQMRPGVSPPPNGGGVWATSPSIRKLRRTDLAVFIGAVAHLAASALQPRAAMLLISTAKPRSRRKAPLTAWVCSPGAVAEARSSTGKRTRCDRTTRDRPP